MNVTKRAKRIQKLFTSQKTVTFEELDTILAGLGFGRRNEGTSHYVYTKNECVITFPRRKPYVKEVYIKRIAEVIEGMI